MGFNAVLAAAGGARNYMARRQIDKRVKCIFALDGNLSDKTGQSSAVCTSPSYESGGPYGNRWFKIVSDGYDVGSPNITATVPATLAGDFAIEYFGKTTDASWELAGVRTSVITIRLGSGALGGNGIKIGDTVIYNAMLATANVITHHAVTRKNGIIRYYRNGILKFTSTATYTQSFCPDGYVGMALKSASSVTEYIGNVRIVDGVCVGNGGATFPVPTSPYTGYEAL